MKLVLSFFLIFLSVATSISCTKDTDIYNKSQKLIGTWHVREIKPVNADMGKLGNVVFKYGVYQFRPDYTFTYTVGNMVIDGKWQITRNREHLSYFNNYEYGLTLTSSFIKGEITQGWFNNLVLNNNRFTLIHNIKGVNTGFYYEFINK